MHCIVSLLVVLEKNSDKTINRKTKMLKFLLDSFLFNKTAVKSLILLLQIRSLNAVCRTDNIF